MNRLFLHVNSYMADSPRVEEAQTLAPVLGNEVSKIIIMSSALRGRWSETH